MLNKISGGKFYNIKSVIHNMNPTAKIICTLIFIILVILAMNIQILGMLALLLGIIILLSNLPIQLFIRQIYSLRYIFLILIMVFYLKGYELNSLLMLMAKVSLIVLNASLLTLTTKTTEITSGLEEFLGVLTVIKIPVNKVSLAISLMLRFIPIMFEQMHLILKTMATRGVDYYQGGYQTKAMALKTMLKPMFGLSVRRTKQIKKAMTVRLYHFHKRRSNYNAKDWGMIDGVLVLAHLSIFAFMTLSRMGWL